MDPFLTTPLKLSSLSAG